MNAKSYQAIVAAPGFALGVNCNDDEILGIAFLEARAEQPPKTMLAKEAVRQLRAYLKDPEFELGLPLAVAGTPFQRRVWERIAAIPPGRTKSYGELADAIHSGPRAVGGACGANPYPIVVPCHRVIAAGGSLGGFARERGGLLLAIKRWLLEHERPTSQPRSLRSAPSLDKQRAVLAEFPVSPRGRG